MSELVDKIRAALAADATAEVRLAGAAACRCALAMIEPAPATAPIAPNVVPQVVAMLRGMDLDQLLTVAVDRLRAVSAAKGDVPTEAPRSIKFPMVPVPGTLTGGSR